MSMICVAAQREVGAPAESVYQYLSNMREHHPNFLPPAFSDFTVEAGGVGAGTITRFKVHAGGRTREYRMQVTEPEPGRVLTESDLNSSMVTTFTVEPRGASSLVKITTGWQGAGGIGGFFERRFAPAMMRRLYLDELQRLDSYAHQHTT
jgi:hypothetical protein